MEYRSIRYERQGRVATLTLARPERYNAIDLHMPGEIADAMGRADADDAVHCVVVQGEGAGFCGGYDLEAFAATPGGNPGVQTEMPWDPMQDYRFMRSCTDAFARLWRGQKPTIAKVHGSAVAGGSDIALSCDLVVMGDRARIGYPPSRVWGVPTTAMWMVRVGIEQAKRMLFCGDVIDGLEAARIGLVLRSVPDDELDDEVDALAARIAAVPRNQLLMHKLLTNAAADQMGLAQAQTMATLFDGIARHSPEGMWWKRLAEEKGWKAAVAWRDSGRDLPDGEQARERG